MLAYIVRRTAYGFAVVLGVLFLLFVLFFLYADPNEMALRAVGESQLSWERGPRRSSATSVMRW